jgi:putative spermidine/putrescine transport system ATP-binding protein
VSIVLNKEMQAVEFVKVTKSFGPMLAVNAVSLSIRRGEFLTVLGPSGCGKSTLLNMIAGFQTQDSGEIRIEGKDVSSMPPYKRDTGMVFQNYALFPHMNVRDNVAFGLQMRKHPKHDIDTEVAKALAMVKLEGMEARKARQLSGGQQQRVALARAIAFGPKVLLLDEPLSALDKSLRSQMQVELKELHERTGLTTIFVTHDQGEALSLSDRIVVMSKGEIQQVSKPLDLYRHPANGFVASFIGEINAFPVADCIVANDHVRFAFGENITLRAPRRDGQPLKTGDKVNLFVRPEHIAVAGQPDNGDPRVTGRIVTHIYQGTHTITRVTVPALGLVELRVEGGDIIERRPVGSDVDLAIMLDNAVIIRS